MHAGGRWRESRKEPELGGAGMGRNHLFWIKEDTGGRITGGAQELAMRDQE